MTDDPDSVTALTQQIARLEAQLEACRQRAAALEGTLARFAEDQRLLDAFLDHVPVNIYFKDRASRFVRVSRAHAAYVGLADPSDALGKTDFDLFSSEHAEQAFADEQEIIRTGTPIPWKEERETWLGRGDTWVLTTKVPLYGEHGEILGTMGISADITARKIAELELENYKAHLEELVKARTSELTIANEQLAKDVRARKAAERRLESQARELAQSNADLERFAYVASHDLQEPLRMVASYTELLARRYKGRLDADADEFIEFAVGGANRMQQLIRDLLSYSRLSTSGPVLRVIASEVACNEAIRILRKPIEESDAKLFLDPLPEVRADVTLLTRLFQNLIGNAIKYRSDRKPEIHVSAKMKDNEWVFSVADNGIGIETQFFERVFQMFQRLHNRRDYPGTGIGLAICQRIVEQHSGRIWVESEPGSGSTFFFTIPASESMES